MLASRAGLRLFNPPKRYRYHLGPISTAFAHTQTPSDPISPEVAGQSSKAEGWFFLDSVFPIQLGTLEFVLFPRRAQTFY